MTRKMTWEKFEMFDEEDLILNIEEESEQFEDKEEREIRIEPITVRTPIGTFSPFEPMCPTKMFDCWTFHTNFDITEKELKLLKSINGIEVLKVMSRYRCFIGIGKMFNFREVRTDIQSLLCGQLSHNSEDSIGNQLVSFFDQMKESNNWAIFLTKDGEILSISEEESEDYEDALLEMMAMKDGNIFIYGKK